MTETNVLRAARANPEPNWLPLVAKADRSELINRKWYDLQKVGPEAREQDGESKLAKIRLAHLSQSSRLR